MASTVKSRPNHYDTLGLTPTASDDEIARAFAREVGLPRAFGGLSEVGIAYETLRDPIKRRAYDASLGFGPKPPPRYVPTASWGGMRFTSGSQGQGSERPARPELPPAAAPVTVQPRPDSPSEPRTASFIAASLRDAADPAPPQHGPFTGAGPSPEQARRRESEMSRALDPPLGGDRILHHAQVPLLGDVEDRPVAWGRPALAVGALVVAVVLLGAWAGTEAGNDIEPPLAVTAALPPPKPLPAAVAPPQAPATSVVETPRWRPPRATVAASIKPRSVAPQPAITEAPPEPVPAERNAAGENVADQANPEAAPIERLAAMPLPNRTIARTIARIGYACGQVASTSPVEGSQGVYKVTCTSGHSYQATPVRGRYHFRRLGSH